MRPNRSITTTLLFLALLAAAPTTRGGDGGLPPPPPLVDAPVVVEAPASSGRPALRPPAPASQPAPPPSRGKAAAFPTAYPAASAENAGDGEPAMAKTFLGMLRYGWEINLVIGTLGFFGLFLFFYFLLETRPDRVAPRWILDRVDDAMLADKPAAALEIVERDSSLLGAVAVAGLRLAGSPAERLDTVLEAAGRRTLGRLRQQVNYLANIGVLSPMLGLLGTVTGLMKAFNVLGSEKLAEGYRAALLGSAIGEAMVTTAVGLLVGIPCMALHFIALDRLGRVGDRLEAATERLSDSLRGKEKP